MKEMKYIVTQRDTELDGVFIEEIFIFPKSVNHDCFAEVVNCIKNETHGNWHRVRRTVISAGFTDGVKCYGHSESLNLNSRKELDTELLKSVWWS